VFKDQQRDLEEIGSKLGVEAVVLGRLVQRGDEISISAELVDVADRHQLWGERYERSIDDLLSIEQEIATTIALKIRSRLSDEQAQQLTHRQTDDSEAYRLYLRGRQYMVGTLDEMDKAVSYFQQAIEREPLYAMAHAGLAQAYVLQGYLLVRDRDEAAALANAAAKRALELDDSLAEARTAAGMIKYYFEWDWEGAEEELRRAVELSPGNAEAYEEYSNYLMSQGRYDEAVKTAQRGAEFDPLSILPVHQLGIAYMAAGDFESAAAQFRQAQELRPSWVWGHIKRGKALAHMGRCDESQEEVTRAEEILAGRGVLSWSWIGWIHAVCGEEQLAREKIEHLQNLSQERHVDPVGLAIIHAGLGNEAEAIELLEQSFSDRSPYMVFNGLFPEFYSIPQLRQNPRFQELLHKLNL
jgi:serine/threonine-protein kinase